MNPRAQYCFTHTLSEWFKDPANTPVDVVAVKTMLDGFIEAWEHEASREEPYQRGSSLLILANHFLKIAKRAQKVESLITCRQGCSHCCRQAVALTAIEAATIVQFATEKQIAIDEEKLKKQIDWSTDEQWAEQPEQDRTCIFLNDGTGDCSIYPARPLACRKYFATSDPQNCNLIQIDRKPVRLWFDVVTEALTSAAMTYFGAGFLPEMILQEIIRKEVQAHGKNVNDG